MYLAKGSEKCRFLPLLWRCFAIVRAGARPIFVDIDSRTLNLDPERVLERAKSTPNLRAILPVHLYGPCADMMAYSELHQS